MIGTSLTSDQATVFKMVCRAAENDDPCPSNAELCEAIGSPWNSTPSDIMLKLERVGLIEREGSGGRRIVTICATGQKTAPPIRTGMERQEPQPDYQDRTPCWRCGARGDVDCGHGWGHG